MSPEMNERILWIGYPLATPDVGTWVGRKSARRLSLGSRRSFVVADTVPVLGGLLPVPRTRGAALRKQPEEPFRDVGPAPVHRTPTPAAHVVGLKRCPGDSWRRG